jgi:hypothetical protein
VGKGQALLVLVAASAALVGALALATPSGARESRFASVTGSGRVTFANFPEVGVSTTEQFAVEAHDGPQGPTGSIVVHSPLYSIAVGKVDVNCIRVDGNVAIVGGTFREPFEFLGARISHFGIVIHDNGAPGSADGDQPDEIHPAEFIDRPRPPTFSPCNLPPNLLALLFPLDTGNFGVSPGR